MTTNTGRWRHGDMSRLLVARFALHGSVRAYQREFRHGVMIEARHLPVTTIVAFGTVRTIATLVAVILLMTAVAGARWLFDAVACAVASSTSCPRMLAQQGEARVLIMVERCRFPRSWRVAAGAIGSARSFVSVILGMTSDAGPRRRPYCIIHTVTSGTGHRTMFANKRKARVARMVEGRRFPCGGRVAAGTVGSARSSVHVILCVTAVTILRKALPALSGVTCEASQATMRANQSKAGLGVIKR